MTSTEHAPITNIEELCRHWETLLRSQEHHGRSMWLMFHGDDGRPDETVVVLDEIPLRPRPGDADGIIAMIRDLVGTSEDSTHCIVLFTRPGTPGNSPCEHDWARALSEISDTMIWPICCGTPHGVQPVLGGQTP